MSSESERVMKIGIGQIDEKGWLILAGIILVIVIVIAVICEKNYKNIIDQKEAEITKLTEKAWQHESNAMYWKGQAEDIAKRVVAASKKIENNKKVAAEKKKQMDEIIVPTGSVEITDRLKEHYPSLEVKCNDK